MNSTIVLAQEDTGNPILNISVFVIFIVITMTIVMRAGKTTKEASDSVSYTHLDVYKRQGTNWLNKLRINKIRSHWGAWICRGIAGVMQIEGPFCMVITQASFPINSHNPLVGGVLIGIPHCRGEIMATSSKGRCQNFP